MQAPAFGHEIAKCVILKSLVLFRAGNAAIHEAPVNIFRLLAGRIAKLRRAEVRHLEFHGDPALLLVVFERAANKSEVVR